MAYHEAIMPAGITYKKIICSMRDRLEGGAWLKTLRLFEAMLNVKYLNIKINEHQIVKIKCFESWGKKHRMLIRLNK